MAFKKEEVKPEVVPSGEDLAGPAYDAYCKEPDGAHTETDSGARRSFVAGFLRGYSAAKGK